jgi:hypothetical protein
MAFDRDTLETIHDATGGACHRCHRTLELADYGRRGEPGRVGDRRDPPAPALDRPAARLRRLPAPAARPAAPPRPAATCPSGPPRAPCPRRIGYAARPRDTPARPAVNTSVDAGS